MAIQVSQFRAAGCKKVFREVASGARSDRCQLRRALEQLTTGGMLTMTTLYRLTR